MNPPANLTLCSGQSVVINFTGTPGSTFNWVNNNTAIGLPASGSGNISFTAAAVTTPEVASITVTPFLAPNTGPSVTFTITVNPIPVIDFIPFIWTCVGKQVDITFTGTPGATFNWTNDNTDIGIPASGTGNIHFTATNVGVTQNAFITITPTLGGCSGPPLELPITVTDYLSMVQTPDQSFCSGEYVQIWAAGIPDLDQLFFTWTNSNTDLGLPASGYGNVEGTLADVTAPVTGTITYSFELFGCPGTPTSYDITVFPYPEMSPLTDLSVCGGDLVKVAFQSPTNPTFEWENSNKLIGLPETGTGDLNFTSANLDVTETGTITVTPVENGCAGTPETFTITVDPLSTMEQPDHVTVCAGQPVDVVFSGTPSGINYNWTNTNPGIGLPPSGTGSSLSFDAANVTTKQIGIITVTPFVGSCLGPSKIFSITVNPIPVVNTPPDKSVCNGSVVNIIFSGTNNPDYQWTNSNTAIGLAAAGSGNINFTTPIVSNQEIATITVAPFSSGCFGLPKSFDITVNPIPVVSDPPDISTCAGEAIDVNFNSNGVDPTYIWTNSNTAIGLPPSGTGDLIFVPGASTTQTATIVVRASENGCLGPPQSFSVSVSPVPIVVSPQANLVACAGSTLAINFVVTPGSTVHWTNSNPAIGLADAGTGFILFNSAQVANIETATITYTPEIGPCVGNPSTFTITINPIPVATDPPNVTTCGGNPVNVVFNGTPGSTFDWTNSNPAIGLGASGSGNLDFITANVATSQSGTITVTPTIGSCVGAPQTFTIAVTPAAAAVNSVANQAVCSGQPITVNFSGTPGATFSWTNNNPAIGLGASGNGNLAFTTASVTTPQISTIAVTPQIGSCFGPPVNFTITVNPIPVAAITGEQTICNGSGTTLTAENGSNYLWSTNDTTATISVAPTSTTTYSVTVSNAGGCSDDATTTVTVHAPNALTIQQTSCNPADVGTSVQTLANQYGCDSVVTTITSLLPSNVTNLVDFTCNPNGGGVFSETLTNQYGCDSTVTTTVLFDPAAVDTTLLAQTNCDPNSVGTFTQLLSNQFGCDSLVITTVSLLPSNLTNLTDFTCNPNNTGTFTQIWANQFGCDSTVITTVLFDPLAADTTLLVQTTCDPSQAGIAQVLLTGADGCDSLIITATNLLPSNTTNLTSTTCDPGSAGTFVQNLTNQSGCDSTIVTTVLLSPVDTTSLTDFTCNPTETGIFSQTLSNQFGCDSLIVTSVLLAPSHVINLVDYTCNPNSTGVFSQNLTNQYGCDSTVITTVLFDPLAADTTLLTKTTCNPMQAGVVQSLFSGTDGCDSLVIVTTTFSSLPPTILNLTTCDPNSAGTFIYDLTTASGCDSAVIMTVTLLPGSTTNLTSTTCDPNSAGTFIQNLTNQFGCDSVVTTIVSLLPTNTTNLTSTTCDPNSAGTFIQNLTNQFGCDSVVTTIVTLLPTNTTNLTSTTCDPGSAGTFIQNLTNQFGCDSVVTTTVSLLPTNVTNLTDFTCNPNSTGTFTQTLTNQFGCDSTVITTVLFDPEAVDTTLLSQTTCDPSQAGTSQTLLSGTDGCDSLVITITSVTSSLLVQATADLVYNAYAISCAGADDGTAQATVSGGAPPYQFAWSNGDITETAINLSAGGYTLTVTDQNGCTTVSSVTLGEPPPLHLSLQIVPPGCGDTLADATAFKTGGVTPYTFTVDGNPVPGSALSFADGVHLVQLTDANGCSADTTVSLSISPPPQITLPGDTVIITGQPLTVEATTNLATWVALEWTPLPDASCAGCLVQSWTPLKTQLYAVRITDSSGCVSEDAIRVVVKDDGELFVPNVFSPDEDGTNDVLLLGAGTSVAALEEISIYDRWGGMVYSWDTPIPVSEWPGWDGLINGKKASLGVYVYSLKVRLVNGNIVQKEGDVTIAKR